MRRKKEKKNESLNTSKEEKKIQKLLSKQRKKRAERQKKEAPPQTAQETIGYEYMFEDGICQVSHGEFSKTYALSDINYQMAPDEEQESIFEQYSDLLNAVDPSTYLQLTLINKKESKEKLLETLYYPLKHDELDIYRAEFNRLNEQNIEQGENNFIRKRLLTIATAGKTKDEGERFLKRTEKELLRNFKKMNVAIQQQTGIERLRVLQELMNPEEFFHFKYEDLKYSGLSTKSAIAPHSFDFRKSKQSFSIGDNQAQVLYLKNYPSDLTDQLLADLMEIPEEFALSLHFRPIPQDEAFRQVKSMKTSIEGEVGERQNKNARRNMSPELIGGALKNRLEDIVEVDRIMRKAKQKLFYTSFFVYVNAPTTEKLQDILEQVKSVGRKNNCTFSRLDFMQEKAFNSVLPLGKNHVDIEKKLTTANCAVLVPFAAPDLQDEGGKFYGINELTNNVILINRQKLKTPSGYILGSPGSGKGVGAKFEMTSTFLKYPEAEILVVDPEDEYRDVGLAFGGQVIDVAPNTQTFINLLDISDLGGEDDPVKLKSEFLTSALRKLLGSLSSSAISMIDRVTRLTYARYFEIEGSSMPTLKNDWFPILKEQPEPVARSLALDLELYINGSVDIFSHASNVDLTNRFVIYNTQRLGSGMKTFGMMVVLEGIWNRVVYNRKRGVPTWIFIDEMQLMISDEYCENFFFELYSRVRKYGAVPTGITQNVETLLESSKARRSLSSSQFVIMLEQAKSDLDELVELFRLSAEQQKYLIAPEKGAGLIRAGNAIVPFSNIIPENTKLYELFTTDPEDRVNQKLKQQEKEVVEVG